MAVLVDNAELSVTAAGTFDVTEWLDTGGQTTTTLVMLDFTQTPTDFVISGFILLESNDKSALSSPPVTETTGAVSGSYYAAPLVCRYFKWQVVVTDPSDGSASGSLLYAVTAR